jgi:cell division cycle 20, cofactor of APC complex
LNGERENSHTPKKSKPSKHSVRSHITGTLRGHTQEVCGLAWDAPGRLLASGGNDNTVNVWEPQGRGAAASVGAAGAAGGAAAAALPGASPALRWRFEAHTAAVKALAWCPFNPAVLASGGGSADGSIRLWNGHTGAALASVSTGAQVCALAWSRTERELVSSHGGPDPRLTLWRGAGLARVGDVRGHAGRALHLALSPDGRTLASAGADETLRFWPLFEPDAHAAARGGVGASVKAGGVGAKAGGMAGRPVTVR